MQHALCCNKQTNLTVSECIQLVWLNSKAFVDSNEKIIYLDRCS